jgi:hypothetical protein
MVAARRLSLLAVLVGAIVVALPAVALADLVASIESESVSHITPNDATLEAQINPEGHAVRYQLQVVSNPDEYRSEIVCPPHPGPPFVCIGEQVGEALPIGFIPGNTLQPGVDYSVSLDLVSAGVIIKPDTTYHYRVIAARSVQTVDTIAWESPPVYGPDQTFTTPPVGQAPAIDSVSVSHLTPTDATLEAQIDTEGLPTLYQFRLSSICGGRGACLVVINYPLPSGLLLGSFQDQGVSVDLNSVGVTLKPGFYEYSLSATSTGGSTEAPGGTFEPPLGVLDPPSPGASPLSGAGQPAVSNGGAQPAASGGSASSSTPDLKSPGLQVPKITKLDALTNAQKRSKALKVCKRKPKRQRASCMKHAHTNHGTAIKKTGAKLPRALG